MYISYLHNIPKLYTIQVLKGFLFGVPIFYSILNSYNLSASDLFLLQAIFAIAVVCFEVPTGFLGDKYGRKQSILIGAILGVIGYMTYIYATGFRGFAIGEIIIALGASCISGCDKALLYDSLYTEKKQESYKKISGIHASLSNFAESAGAIISGIIATHGLKLPFYCDVITGILAIFVVISLREVPIERFDHKEAGWKQIREVYRYIMHGHQFLGWLLLLGAFLMGTSLSLVWITQPYMQHIGISLIGIGIIRSGLNLSVAIFHLIAHRYETRLGPKNTFLSIIGLRTFAMLFAGWILNIWGMISFIVFAFTRAAQRSVSEDIMQTAVISKMRATISSVQSMLFRFSFVILGPCIGYLHDHVGLRYALRIFAGITCICSGYLFQKFQGSYKQ